MASQISAHPLNWETCGPTEALVSTPTSKLNVIVSGDARQPGAPVVIFESGAGMTTPNWSAVARLLPRSIRSYRYDRTGLGLSEPSTAPRTATNMARELLELLQTAKIHPPYIFVVHTYGAFIAREFLALVPAGTITGMLFADATQERTIEVLRPGNAGETFLSGFKWEEVVGLGKEHKLLPEEWTRWRNECESVRHPETSVAEWKCIPESTDVLRSRKQFETHPLSPYPITFVTGNYARDLERVIAFAKERNLATDEQLEPIQGELDRVHEFEEGLHRQQLELSSNQRYVYAEHSGHAPQFTEPQLIADEVARIVDEVVAKYREVVINGRTYPLGPIPCRLP